MKLQLSRYTSETLFIAFHFIALHRCVFRKLKARTSTSEASGQDGEVDKCCACFFAQPHQNHN